MSDKRLHSHLYTISCHFNYLIIYCVLVVYGVRAVLLYRNQRERDVELQRELAEVDEMFRSVLAASVATKFLGRFVNEVGESTSCN